MDLGISSKNYADFTKLNIILLFDSLFTIFLFLIQGISSNFLSWPTNRPVNYYVQKIVLSESNKNHGCAFRIVNLGVIAEEVNWLISNA